MTLLEEVLKEIERLDPKHERIKINSNEDGWMVVITDIPMFIHPQSFLDVVRNKPHVDLLK